MARIQGYVDKAGVIVHHGTSAQTKTGRVGYTSSGETTTVLNVSGSGTVHLFVLYMRKENATYTVNYTIDGASITVFLQSDENGMYHTLPGFAYSTSAKIDITVDSNSGSGTSGADYLINYES